MNIRELNAALIVMGGLPTTLFGETIMVNRHTVTIAENGNINVDHNPVGRVKDEDKWALVQTIVEVTS